MRSGPEDLGLFAACFRDNGFPRSPPSLRWQYVDNPTGRLFADLAVAGEAGAPERLAAIYATLPVRVRVDGNVRLALQSLDTLTDRDFRGKGLFVSLAQATYARAASEGAAFIYGFPNGNSAPGFYSKLGWQSLDPVPFLIRPLRSRYVSARLKLGRLDSWVPDVRLAGLRRPRIPGALELVKVERFDEAFTELWSRFASSIGVAVERDATYLNWRLVDKPEESYHRLALFERGAPVAFVAFALKEKHGGRIGYIMELLFLPGRQREARTLLHAAVADLARAGADVALAWACGHSPGFSSYLRSGFVPFPTRLRPIELHFGARAFDPLVADVVGRRSNWYLSYLDSDTV